MLRRFALKILTFLLILSATNFESVARADFCPLNKGDTFFIKTTLTHNPDVVWFEQCRFANSEINKNPLYRKPIGNDCETLADIPLHDLESALSVENLYSIAKPTGNLGKILLYGLIPYWAAIAAWGTEEIIKSLLPQAALDDLIRIDEAQVKSQMMKITLRDAQGKGPRDPYGCTNIERDIRSFGRHLERVLNEISDRKLAAELERLPLIYDGPMSRPREEESDNGPFFEEVPTSYVLRPIE